MITKIGLVAFGSALGGLSRWGVTVGSARLADSTSALPAASARTWSKSTGSTLAAILFSVHDGGYACVG